jgi:hypothetical protein
MVYFIQAEGVRLIKIGLSVGGIRERLFTLRTMSPVPLRCIGLMEGDRDVEIELHRRFRDLRSHGEWFWPGRELIKFIEDSARQPDDAEFRPNLGRRSTPVQTMLYCPDGFSSLLLSLAERMKTNIPGLIDLAARTWAEKKGLVGPPSLPAEILARRTKGRNRDRSSMMVPGTREWRSWFNETADSTSMDVNKLMRMIVAEFAESLGHAG